MSPQAQIALDPAARMLPRERFLRAVAGRDVDRPPLWFMRQAGRYLPEYRALRERYTFHERLRDPDIAAEITLQPLARFPLDAAVLFSDILVPLEAMGVAVTYEGGPRIEPVVRSREAVDALTPIDPRRDIPYVGEAIRTVREAIPDHVVLGFAGAPFTLAAYLVQGAGSKGFPELLRFAHGDPEAWRVLMDRLVEAVTAHLAYQAENGADVLQLFDTWAEILSPQDYEALALPHVTRVIRETRSKTGRPVVYFARGTSHLLPHLEATTADVWSVDWRVQLERIRERAPDMTLQGNLDPAVLFAPPETVRAPTRRVLDALGAERHIFNLGHGILPGTPIEGVEAMVEEVVRWRASA